MLLALLLQFFIATDLGPIPTAGQPPPAEMRELRAELTAALNQHRTQAGLEALVTDPIAEQAAQYQADNMLNTGTMGHLDSTGRSPAERYKSFGGKSDYYGENVGFSSPGVVDPQPLWDAVEKLDADMMAEAPPEDGHRKNILSAHYTAVGIGLAVGPNGVYLCEDFSSIKPQ